MKHTYKISGMSCMGCKNSVEKTLSSLKEVDKITIDFPQALATIETQNHVSLEKYQQALLNAGLHYTIELPNSNGGSQVQKKP